MYNICVVQARLNSSRLPNKIFIPFKGTNLLNYILKKINHNENIHKNILAVPENQLQEIKYKSAYYDNIFGGSEKDLISRYLKSVQEFKNKINCIVRITSDCPCVNMDILNTMITFFNENIKKGYLCNTNFKGCMCSGLDIEIFDYDSLEKIYKNSPEREHLAIAFGKNNLNIPCFGFTTRNTINNIELSIDTLKDIEFVNNFYDKNILKKLKINLNDFIVEKLNYDHSVHFLGRERRL